MIRLQETTVIHAPIHHCLDLARSVEVHLIANIHSGEQALAVGRVTSGLVGLGQQAEVLFLRRYMLSLLRERNAVIGASERS